MTTTAWGVGLRNASVTLVGLLALSCALAAAVALVADPTFSASWGPAFNLLWTFFLGLFAFSWPSRQVGLRAGSAGLRTTPVAVAIPA